MADTTLLNASAAVPLPDPLGMLDRLCDHLAEHGTVTRSERGGRFENPFGVVALEAGNETLHLRASSPHTNYLFLTRSLLAEHIVAFADGEPPAFAWTGDGCDTAAIPYFHAATVRGSRLVTPRMQRVTLGVADTGRLETGGLHVRVLIPPRGRVPVWPSLAADSRVLWPKGEDALTARVYTIRSLDHARGEVDIDVVLHEDSPGSVWAREARAGDAVGLMGPGGGEVIPADWYLLCGDETALPAIARMTATLPRSARATIIVEVADRFEEQALESDAAIEITWLHRNDAPAGSTDLLPRAVAALERPPTGEPFAFVGCEQAAARAIRKHLRTAWRLPKDRHRVAAYWRRGHAEPEPGDPDE